MKSTLLTNTETRPSLECLEPSFSDECVCQKCCRLQVLKFQVFRQAAPPPPLLRLLPPLQEPVTTPAQRA